MKRSIFLSIFVENTIIMDLENTFYIQSKYLQLVEPLMEKYFDYDSSMLEDDIQSCVEQNGINYMTVENDILKVNYRKPFNENEHLRIYNFRYSHKSGIEKESTYKDIADEFPKYFDFESKDEETRVENSKVYLCLSYMAYIYYKEKNDLFIYIPVEIENPKTGKIEITYERSFLIDGIDIEYQSTLHTKIYPEMLSLYRIILESKKYKKRGDKLTITYKQDKIDLNTSAWFLNDMEAYFKNRFPNLTLEDINELLPPPNKKGGRKFIDRTVNNIIWGTYQLLYNHHSQFKNSNVKISKEICDFIIQYLNYLNIKHDYVDTDIKDKLKDMIKRNYIPKWDLPWRNVFSSIQEKQPESELERLNQPLQRYDLSNL